MKWNFDLSYSSYSTYKDSQLIFFFNKIVKAKPDTEVNQVYGNLGQIIHTYAEEYIKDKNIWENQIFNELWVKYNIDNRRGFYNSIIKKDKWFNYLLIVKKFIELNLFTKNNVVTEKYLEYEGEEFEGMKIKGYIDVFIKNDNKIYLYDWKTNSQHSEKLHLLQRKFYSWLCYKVYDIIPKECNWFYTNKAKSYKTTFTKEEMDNFTEELLKFKDDIIIKTKKGISAFEIGDINSPFNGHRQKCEMIKHQRENKVSINIRIQKNKIHFDSTLPETVKKVLKEKYSYKVAGCEWSEKYKNRLWDGMKYLFTWNSLPIGFLNDVKQLILDYNKYFNTNFVVLIDDQRDKRVIDKSFETVFKKSDKILREYQKDSVEKAITNKIGIIYNGTGGGKTLIASEIIRRLNKRTLFLVNRLELCNQTHETFSEELGVDVGLMSEGNLDINKQIVVASVMTIVSILKRNDETSKQLSIFLYNVNCMIWDECQNVSDTGIYNIIYNKIVNAEYILGLSGTPFRNN